MVTKFEPSACLCVSISGAAPAGPNTYKVKSIVLSTPTKRQFKTVVPQLSEYKEMWSRAVPWIRGPEWHQTQAVIFVGYFLRWWCYSEEQQPKESKPGLRVLAFYLPCNRKLAASISSYLMSASLVLVPLRLYSSFCGSSFLLNPEWTLVTRSLLRCIYSHFDFDFFSRLSLRRDLP